MDAWATEELEALVRHLSHDLRAPMRQAVAFTELARHSPGDAEALAGAEAAAARALAALDALVEYTRFGTRPPTLAPVHLAGVAPGLPAVEVRGNAEALKLALRRLGTPREVELGADAVLLRFPSPAAPVELDLSRGVDPSAALAVRALRVMGAQVEVEAESLRVRLPRVAPGATG